MGEVEEVLAIGIHLEAICTTTNGQIKELSRTKWVVGDLPLLRSPRAIQKAVPNHSALSHVGVNVQSRVPRGAHLEVDDKALGCGGYVALDNDGSSSYEPPLQSPIKWHGRVEGWGSLHGRQSALLLIVLSGTWVRLSRHGHLV